MDSKSIEFFRVSGFFSYKNYCFESAEQIFKSKYFAFD